MKGLKSELESLTDGDLGMRIHKVGYESHLRLYREKHRPLQIKIELDYNHYRAQNQAFKENQKRNRRRDNQSNSLFRMYWIYWVFGGIILSILYAFSSVFLAILEAITPGWSDTARGMLIAIIAVAIILVLVFLVPRFKSRRAVSNAKLDSLILGDLVGYLSNLEIAMTDTETMKCWSCFADMDVGDEFCPKCGKSQN
jgi:hypothetical protein